MWEWVNQAPEFNFDDYGPQDYVAFTMEMRQRQLVEMQSIALLDHRPVGIMTFLPLTERMGMLHGICFDESVHGKGVAQWAMMDFLAAVFDGPIEKICASFFADNLRVHRFLTKLGAEDEGLMRRHTIRKGLAIDMRMIAFFKES